MIGRWTRLQAEDAAVVRLGGDDAVRAQRQAVTIAGLQRELEIAHGVITRLSGENEQLRTVLAQRGEELAEARADLGDVRWQLAALHPAPRPAVVVEEPDLAHWRRRAVLAEGNCLRYEQRLAELRDADPEHRAVVGSGPVWGGP